MHEPVPQQDTDTALGELLRELRMKKGLSVKRLAKLAGISRKTIDNAESGLNVSVFVLKKLLRPMGVSEITISVAGAHSARTGALTPETVTSLAAEIRHSAELLTATASALEELSGAPPQSEDLAGEAEDLIKAFSSYVRTVENPGQLATLRETVTSLAAPDRKNRSTGTSRPRKRRTA